MGCSGDPNIRTPNLDAMAGFMEHGDRWNSALHSLPRRATNVAVSPSMYPEPQWHASSMVREPWRPSLGRPAERDVDREFLIPVEDVFDRLLREVSAGIVDFHTGDSFILPDVTRRA